MTRLPQYFFTSLSPPCYNLGTTLYFETVGCMNIVTRLSQGCGGVVKCYNVVTRLLQGCDKHDFVVTWLQ